MAGIHMSLIVSLISHRLNKLSDLVITKIPSDGLCTFGSIVFRGKRGYQRFPNADNDTV
ncbi:hypothetical protein Bca101_068324 [Brassica carinata]